MAQVGNYIEIHQTHPCIVRQLRRLFRDIHDGGIADIRAGSDRSCRLSNIEFSFCHFLSNDLIRPGPLQFLK